MTSSRQTRTPLPVDQYHTISSKLVHLDGENPRHTSLDREPDIIKALCDDQLITLANDIARRGAMSPLEVIGVIEHEGMPGHYIAVEGNRRTCALILLADPARAPNAEFRNIFTRISEDSKTPNELHVYLFGTREKAQPWIDLRHLGLQGGAGTREWGPNEKARAAARSPANTSAKADILALRIIERLVALGLLSNEQAAAIPLTTLSRYLNNKTRRAIFGLADLDIDSNLVYTHEPLEVDAALHRFALDSLPTDDDSTPRVNSRAKAKDADEYVGQFASEGHAPTSRLETPASPPTPAPAQPRGSASGSSNPSASRTRSAPNPALRAKFISSSFTVRSRDKVLGRLRTEMMGLPIEHNEFAANYLLRAFVERVLILYLRHTNPGCQPKNEAELCQHCARAAQSSNAPRGVQHVLNQANSDKHVAHSLHTLGTAVHGSTIPNRRQLIAAFDTWEPALRFMLDALES